MMGTLKGFLGLKEMKIHLSYTSQPDGHTNVFSRALRDICSMKEQIYHKALS
jgi:hypothetical protein